LNTNLNETNQDLQFIQNSMIEYEPEGVLNNMNDNDLEQSMERYRNEMDEIAKYNDSFNLSKLPDIYLDHFHRNIRSVYNGKLKELILYFRDIFKLQHNPHNNQTIIISLNHPNHKNIKNIKNKNKVNGISLLKSAKQRFVNNDNLKKKEKLRWAPKTKKKEDFNLILNEEQKNNKKRNENDFRFGPSAMYTVPRAAPKSHSHLIGVTAAVGTANAYKANPYSSRSGNVRFGTSNVRPYLSSRKHQSKYSSKKAKTYGDYEDDNLPHTPSGSEDDDDY